MYSLIYDNRHARPSDSYLTIDAKRIAAPLLRERKIAIVGLGDSGLQLATKLGEKQRVVAFDISGSRVSELAHSIDRSGFFSAEQLSESNIVFTARLNDLASCDFYIITMPISKDDSGRPDVGPLLDVSTIVGSCLQRGDIVVYTEAIFPGATEEYCIPVLELASGFNSRTDFTVGFSPSTICFGQTGHDWPYQLNLIAGQDSGTLAIVKHVFSKIYANGVCEAPSIRAAEAAEALNGIQPLGSVASMDAARRQRSRTVVCNERWA